MVLNGGVSGTPVGVGQEASSPLHIVSKPTPYSVGEGGHYRITRRFVPAGTTLTGHLWAFRWTDSAKLCVIQRARLRALQVGAPTAAVEDRFSLYRAVGYTVSETTNATTITPATSMNMLRSVMGDAAAIIQESSAAAGLTGGARTLDTNPLSNGSLWVMAAVSSAQGNHIEVFDYQPRIDQGEHPLVLGQNEGFMIDNDNAMGVASGIVLYLELVWAELAASSF